MLAIALQPASTATTTPPPELSKVALALLHSPYRHLHRLACDLDNGEFVLRGTVGSYYLKQIAQEAARKVMGCWTLRNEIEVADKSYPESN